MSGVSAENTNMTDNSLLSDVNDNATVLSQSDNAVTIIKSFSDESNNNLLTSSENNNKLTDKGKPKVLFLLGGLKGTTETNIAFLEAINSRKDIDSNIASKNKLENINFNDYDLVFIDAIWPSTPDYMDIKDKLQDAMKNNVTVVTRAIYKIADWRDVGNVDMDAHTWIPTYWTNINKYMTPISIHNANNLVDYLCTKFLGLNSINKGGKPLEPILLPKQGIYYPTYSSYFKNLSSYLNWYNYSSDKPTIAICFGQGDFNNLETEVIDSLIKKIESKGMNVISYFYDHEGRAEGEPNAETYLMINSKFYPDLVIHYRAANWNTVDSNENVTAELERYNVPIVKALTYNGNYSQWLNDSMGLDQAQFAYTLSNMEIQGIFNPIVIATKELKSDGLIKKTPIDRQIDWLLNSSIAWIKLSPKYTNNSDKKVAIIYWSSPGKDKGAGASHLDVCNSMPVLLNYLKSQGYNLGNNDLPDTEEFVKLTRSQGLNIGIWAPGELKKLVENYPVVLVSEEKYLSWFNQLNPEKTSRSN